MAAATVLALVGLGLVGMGGVAWADPPPGQVGQQGPTPPKLGDPVKYQSEVQWIVIAVTSPPASGTFTITNPETGQTTAPIPFDVNATSLRTALGAIVPGGAASLFVAGGPISLDYDADGVLIGEWYFRVQWVGAQKGLDKPLLQVASQPTGATVSVEPYRDGATYGDRLQPHGGYSAVTDFCLQCHKVHDAEEYALLAQASVTATCRTCHSLFGQAPTGARDPGFPTAEAPTSMRSAYEIANPAGAHAIGATNIPMGSPAAGPITQLGWAYGGWNPTSWVANRQAAGAGTATDLSGGLYCGSCHTPHGDFGRLINSPNGGADTTADGDPDVDAWANDTAIYLGTVIRYLWYDTAEKVWKACTAQNGGGTCTYLLATDTEGEDAYLYGYKLLSAHPNHSWEKPVRSWGVDYRNRDQVRWCGRCHDMAVPSEFGGTYHNHPTSCTACHGNPRDATSNDFPHTSTFDRLLGDYPDLLCINCHSAGSLP